MWRRTILLFVPLLGLLVGPALLVRATIHDAEPPDGLARPINEFGDVPANELDMPLGTHVRFVDYESRQDDQLRILFFELRPWPYIGPPNIGYLVSRCSPVEALDPHGMGGGLVLGGDVQLDPELEYLRDIEAQSACP